MQMHGFRSYTATLKEARLRMNTNATGKALGWGA